MKHILAFLICALPLTAQVKTVGAVADSSAIINYTAASRTATRKVVTTLPSTCTVGDQVFKSDATAGQNLYSCTATNTWTVQGGSSSGGGTSMQFGTTLATAQVPASSTLYASPGATTMSNVANREFIVPSACTMRNLVFRTASAQTGSGTLVVSLYSFATGANTVITVTVPAGAVAGVFSDTTHTVSAALGDRFAFSLVNSSTTNSAAQITGIGILCN